MLEASLEESYQPNGISQLSSLVCNAKIISNLRLGAHCPVAMFHELRPRDGNYEAKLDICFCLVSR